MRKQRYHAAWKLSLAGAMVLLWLIRSRPFRVEVSGMSMTPTLEPGDFLLATRGARIDAGRLVVVQHPTRPGYEMVKRVGALPGERVGDHTLGAHEYWILGDQPRRSTDSRTFGPVGSDDIKGVIRLRYWPPSRWSRLG